MADIDALIQTCEARLAPTWQGLEARCHTNFERVLTAFLDHQLSENHFTSVTGYGHDDTGRDVTDRIFAQVFQAEAAIVRLQFVSGTHAIACALRGTLEPGDTLVSITGKPYDTLEEVIGLRGDSAFSLKRQGIAYTQLDLLDTGHVRLAWTQAEQEAIEKAKTVFIQRSRGYNLFRPSLTLANIQDLIAGVRQIHPEAVVVVDNCYGEFVDTQEPCAVGADLIAGSLIKNPGGGLVSTGGYIAGKAKWVGHAADALTAPGIGADGGYTFDATRQILQGLYFAPTVVKEALKGMRLAASVLEEMGYEVHPKPQDPQADIIQVLELGDKEQLLAFCRTLQSISPVDARLMPEPAVTPGYADPVVMAGGTFIFGSTIELSADAPVRPPYCVFLQGGLTYSHVRFAIKRIATVLAQQGITTPV